MSKRSSARPSETDWKRLDAMTDDDIDFSDDPEATPEMFARAVVRKGFKPIPAKQQVTLRLDADVLEWFKAQGKGYQTRINALLRAYKEASESKRS
ncbi:MAG: BrnA antitoxin family protein [Gammaproteobacteria bacterium]